MAQVQSYRRALYAAVELSQRCSSADARAFYAAHAAMLRRSITILTGHRVRWS